MDLKRGFALFAIIATGFAAPAAAQDADCNLLSPQVAQTPVYSGYSADRMCAAGLKPLWQGLPDGADRVMRFTFSSGHSLFWRSVTITRRPDGTGLLEVVGGGRRNHDARSAWIDLRPKRRKLSREQVATITALADQSGTFDFEVGTWDQSADGEVEIFLHCQTLDLEQADAAGYRFSSVNIGCNRPAKLMPLVDAVIRLADIGMVRRNWAGYR
jgi:hypothetical protein